MRPDLGTRRNLPLLLLHAREVAMGHFRPILKRFGVTDQQWRILRALFAANDGLEPSQIAAACQILRPSLTGILGRLEDMKLVRRAWSTLDQRRQRIRLTVRGTALVERVLPHIDEQYRRIEKTVGRDALEDIYRNLDAALELLRREVPSALEAIVPSAARGQRGRRVRLAAPPPGTARDAG